MKNKVLYVMLVVMLCLLIMGCEVSAQEPYEGTLSFHWDTSGEVVFEEPVAVINQCVVEIRQDGEVVEGSWVTFSIPDCVPLEEPGTGQCGSNAPFTLNTPFGSSEVWVRCVWIADGAVLAYLDLDPQAEMDEDHFWLLETIERWRVLNVPQQFRGG